jgi:type II secretory pathway component PulF
METFLRWLIAPFWSVLFGRAEATRQATLLRTLAIAVEKQYPVVNFLEALADEAGGRWGWKVRGLADLISAGVAIPDALEAHSGVLPEDTVALVRVGAQTGNMSGALHEAANLARRRSENTAVRFHGILLYFCLLFVLLASFSTFLMVWIIPKFKAIFEGFEVKMPPLTEAVIRISDYGAIYWYLAFLFPLAIFGLWMVFSSKLESLGWGPVWGRSAFNPFGQRQRLRTPHVLRCLSIAVDAGRPLGVALAVLASRHPDRMLRLRMAILAGQVEEGEDCWLAMGNARLLRQGEAALLEAAQRVGNLAWALRSLADGIERRAEYRFQLILEFTQPALTVAVGTIIGTFCVSMFLPLIVLLRKLS